MAGDASTSLGMTRRNQRSLHVRLGFRKANDFSAFLPLPTLLQQFHALEALQDVAPGGDGAGTF
jgi:hypothetical protein